MGSKSDSEVMESCTIELERFGIDYEVKVSSAHRNPDGTRKLVEEAVESGVRVFIAGAGMSAALPGFIASLTVLPVIGVPIASGLPGGLDSVFSMVQMPPGIPVATVSVGKAGARNAAILAAEILSINNDSIKARLNDMRSKWREG
ncbi:MAG: 5-(carboxyamino)imidazole ribonucleotide mutase [Candidatus Latescibacteria bacterium 4484_7]|nr:MAG: 5-(carboxyamino)imidazole ribonucleotide mutase [Candidatus Latescibacteria bacterium 4484_7]